MAHFFMVHCVEAVIWIKAMPREEERGRWKWSC